jgi:hypothetical protein
MSSNKEVTIRRGERGLSSALHRGGLNLGGIYSLDRLDGAVARLSKTELLDGLRNSILLKPKDRRKRLVLLASETCDNQWRDDARRFMSEMARRKNMIGVHPTFCVDQLGVEIVKKNSEMHYRLARQHLLHHLCQGANGLQLPSFKEELATMAHRDALPKGLYSASLGRALTSEPRLRPLEKSTKSKPSSITLTANVTTRA